MISVRLSPRVEHKKGPLKLRLRVSLRAANKFFGNSAAFAMLAFE